MELLKLVGRFLLLSSLLSSSFRTLGGGTGPTGAEAAEPADRTTAIDAHHPQQNAPFRSSTYSTTWQLPDGSLRTDLSLEPLNYQDRKGQWQTVDARFTADQDSFVVERNTIQTRADNRRLWLSAVVSDTLFAWETLALGEIHASGDYRRLAAPLEKPAPIAYRRDENRELVYENTWDDQSISEALLSAPGSLEHLVIMKNRPAQPGPGVEFLELRARLSLLKTSRLLADGRPAASGQAASQLQIQDAQGRSILQFAPLLSYEQDDRMASVAGSYFIQAGDETGEWIVGMRTPWSWLADPDRRYPVVLDPTMKVLTPTPTDFGLAWISDQYNQYTYGALMLGAYSPDYNSLARGYFQFRDLPAILTNAPIKVKKATLQASVSEMFLPEYYDSPKDWDEMVINRKGTLYYVGACPGDCAGFSLHDSRLQNSATYNWSNSPAGTPVSVGAEQKISFGPEKGKKKTHVTTWEVTTEISNWYNAYFTNPQDHWPAFRLSLNETCPGPLPYYQYIDFNPAKSIFTYKDVPNCTNFSIPKENITLSIEYDLLPLALNANLLNKPGVPSSLPGIFEDTDHSYQLATYDPTQTGGSFWRALAVQGNHDFTPGLPTTASLQLFDSGSGQMLGSASALTPDRTAVLFINDPAQPGLPGTPLHASIPPAPGQNDYPSDLQRNYRLEYKLGEYKAIAHGSWDSLYPNEPFYSDELVKVVEFDIVEGETLNVQATLPITMTAVLIKPGPTTSPEEAVLGFPSSRILHLVPEEGGNGSKTVPNARAGRWALAYLNNGKPKICPTGDDCGPAGGPTVLQVGAMILACPAGSVPTGDYGCQVVQMPDPDASDLVATIDVPNSTNELNLYTEFALQTLPGGWCTQTESTGTPALRRQSQANNRAVIVANGRVCYIDGQLFLASKDSTDPATSRAAVNLAMPLAGSPPANPRGMIGTDFIYGDSGKHYFQPGDKIGQFTLAADGSLLPATNTRLNIELFRGYWGQANVTTNSYIINTLSAKLEADENLSAQVSSEVNQTAMPSDWHVSWELYPSAPQVIGYPSYTFTPNVVHTSPLPDEILVASMTLRLTSTGSADGRLPQLLAELTDSGPVAYQFITDEARITMDPRLGEASQKVKAVALPTGLARPPDGEDKCSDGGVLTSCLDVRAADYAYDPVGAKDKPAAWSLPDIHIQEGLGAVVFSQSGYLSAYSVDHPLAVQDFAQAFSFDTWGAKVAVSSAACTPGGPVTTITRGEGFVSLPGIASDGSSDPGKWIKVKFELCQTNLHEASLTLSIEPGAVPVGSTGLGVGLIGGTVTVGPDYTQIVIDVHFRSLDGSLFNDGEGSVTINTKGMFDLQGSGNLVGFVRADTLELQVAWNPLDILFQGEVSCCGDLISGYMNMHGWFGKGWQNQYSWINDDKFHFTGSIGGTIGVEKGDLINKKYFKIPPFDLGFKAEISFGDFCSGSGCSSIEWGMAATITVFGYDAGVYVSAGGPSIFLGNSSIKLVDQYAGAKMSLAQLGSTNAVSSNMPVNSNPAAQSLTVGYDTPFDALVPADGSLICATGDPKVYECSFAVPDGSNRALFIASWLNGFLKVSLIKPDNTVVTQANAAANGVEISVPPASLDGRMISFAATPTSGSLLPAGTWKVRLEDVASDSYFALTFAADPPAPSLSWSHPLLPGTTPDGSGHLNLQWNATRAGASLPDDVRAELFFAPVIEPLTFPSLYVSFPGSYQAAAGLGSDWDPAAPAILAEDNNHDGVWKLDTSTIPAGEYAYKAALNGDWVVNYGLGGVRDGENITMTMPTAGGQLSFYFDAADKYITTRPQSDIIVLVGDMLSEIGGADWAPSNLVGWLKPTENADQFELTLHLPEGSWNYKVALNESWTVNYGAGGALNGPNIPLVVPDGGALIRFTYHTDTHLIEHTLLAGASGAPIVAKLAANLGSYNWDTRGLASGEYQVGMRIVDQIKSNGPVVSWAPGTVTINDTTPPPKPVYSGKQKYYDGLVLHWLRDDVTPDLAGYWIEYHIPDWSQLHALPKSLRITPSPKAVNPLFQSARLGGIFGGVFPSNAVEFCIHAYDASGNLSDCDVITEEILPDEEPPLGRISRLDFFPEQTNFTATWTPPVGGGADGYLVSYAPTGCALPAVQALASEGSSPLIQAATSATLTGLTVGQRYRLGVRAYNLAGQIGSEIFASAYFGDPADADDDFLPDSWEATFGITDPLADDDQDGMDNQDEYDAGTFPNEPDSDRDGYYDSQEVEQASNPCGPGTRLVEPDTRLAVVGSSELVFHNPVNLGPVDFAYLTILNLGAGNMNWEALASQPWIILSHPNGQDDQPLLVRADPTGLAVGAYEGTITIQTTRSALNSSLAPDALQESVTIPVTLVVLPQKELELFLPLVTR